MAGSKQIPEPWRFFLEELDHQAGREHTESFLLSAKSERRITANGHTGSPTTGGNAPSVPDLVLHV